MKRLVILVSILLVVCFGAVSALSAAEDANSRTIAPAAKSVADTNSTAAKGATVKNISLAQFERVANKLVKAFNDANYPAIQADFGKAMLEALPLEKLTPFFQDLFVKYGRIRKIDAPRLVPPDQAIFLTHFMRTDLDMKIVLDSQDKITGLWFLPPVADAKGTTADVNDANSPAAEWHKELGEKLAEVEQTGQEELREWMAGMAESRVSRLKAAYNQVAAELGLVREIALKEQAVKTVEAIDRILAERNERLNELVQKAQEERKKERERQQAERTAARRRPPEEQHRPTPTPRREREPAPPR